MKIYTKRGDDGTTGLFGGTRVAKSARRIDAYGTVDELNSVIGVVRAESPSPRTEAMLDVIQHQLFVLGADLATEMGAKDEARVQRIGEQETRVLEACIDEIDAQLPPLQVFILPGGTKSAAQLHVARTVCRRAERSVVLLAAETTIGPGPVAYLNRLSDLLFVLARFENAQRNVRDVEWKP